MINYELRLASCFLRAALRVEVKKKSKRKFCEFENISHELAIYFTSWKFLLRNAFLSRYTLFSYKQHFISNPRLRFEIFLPNPVNITPFVKWNKQKERACCKMNAFSWYNLVGSETNFPAKLV